MFYSGRSIDSEYEAFIDAYAVFMTVHAIASQEASQQ